MDLKRNTKLNAGIYVLALVGTCLAQLNGWRGVELLCKPLLMVVLSSWFYFNSRRMGDRFTLLVQAGLFFSLVGDVALMFTAVDDFNFLIGLGAFFLAQLCYGFAFIQNILDAGDMSGLLPSALMAIAIAAYAFFFTWDLLPHVEEGLEMPVIAYVGAITLMGITAAFRYRRTWPRSFWLVLGGALLFMASDSALAWNRFRMTLDHAPLWIMVPYALGQAMLAAGALVHVQDPEASGRQRPMPV
ncbi:MAG: lysoplasmalogenase [Flavobacteriales bacterium]|nr:lysoplasmalogenase [Flavobacteriales bacterium]